MIYCRKSKSRVPLRCRRSRVRAAAPGLLPMHLRPQRVRSISSWREPCRGLNLVFYSRIPFVKKSIIAASEVHRGGPLTLDLVDSADVVVRNWIVSLYKLYWYIDRRATLVSMKCFIFVGTRSGLIDKLKSCHSFTSKGSRRCGGTRRLPSRLHCSTTQSARRYSKLAEIRRNVNESATPVNPFALCS